MAERWLPVVGYEGRYEVSDCGRVRSLPRVEFTTKGHRRIVRGGILKPNRDRLGYTFVGLRAAGSAKSAPIHRLVAEAFVPGRNSLHREVAHLDGTRDNARADNLKWVSKRENRSHRKLHGTHNAGQDHGLAKLTNEQAARIRSLRGKVKYRLLAEEYGVSIRTIHSVVYGKRYRCAGGVLP